MDVQSDRGEGKVDVESANLKSLFEKILKKGHE